MDIGALRHPVTIQKYSYKQDPNTGNVTEQWTDFSPDWANIRGISGREFIAAAAVQNEADYRVTIRYRTDFDETARFMLKDGSILEIESMLPDNKRRYLLIMCKYMRDVRP